MTSEPTRFAQLVCALSSRLAGATGAGVPPVPAHIDYVRNF
jgi:hypothetical protein